MTDDDLTSDEAAAVFRRAAELDLRHSSTPGRGLDFAALEQAGVEAGLSRDSIRQALAEIKAGALEQTVRQHDAVITRTLRGSDLEHEIERFMRQQRLRVARRFGDRTVWEPETGLGASLAKSLDFNRRIVLREITQLTTCVVPVPGSPGLSHVRLELDLMRVRRGWYTIPIVTAVVSAGSVALLPVAGVDLLPAIAVGVPGAGVATGGAYVAARAGYRGSLRRSVNGIERFLDRLEHGR